MPRLHASRQAVSAALIAAALLAGAADWGLRAVEAGLRGDAKAPALAPAAVHALVTLNGLLQRLAGRFMVSRTKDIDVVRLSNGHLTLGPVARPPGLREKAASDIALVLSEVRKRLAKDGIPLAFVLCPSKNPPGKPSMPRGLEDDDNLLADRLVAALSGAGIPCLDLRERIAAEGLDHASLFFRTDHHWTPATGLWAARQVSAFLRERFGFATAENLFDASRFRTVRQPERMLGSFGRRAGLGYAGDDPFEVVVPDFPVRYRFEAPAAGLSAEGGFERAFLHRPAGCGTDPYDRIQYDDFLASTQPLVRIVNETGGNGRTLCIVKDSFASVLVPHLAAAYGKIVLVDPRKDRQLSLFRVVRDEGADAVLWMLNPDSLIRKKGFFGSGLVRPLP